MDRKRSRRHQLHAGEPIRERLGEIVLVQLVAVVEVRDRPGDPQHPVVSATAERETLARALDESSAAGRVVVVLGEAGIGKTALVTAATATLAGRAVLWGACDPLVTPRPLGAWWDVAITEAPRSAGQKKARSAYERARRRQALGA